jgi:hypothetical protein
VLIKMAKVWEETQFETGFSAMMVQLPVNVDVNIAAGPLRTAFEEVHV